MKNRVLLIFLAMMLVVSLLVFAACKDEETPPVEEEVPPVEEVWQWPDKLAIQTHGVESQSYGGAVGWTTPLADDTGMSIRVVAETNTVLRYRNNKDGLFLCFSRGGDFPPILKAEAEFASRDMGPYQIRDIYAQAKTDMGYAVRGDSGIKTPEDIKPGTKLIYFSYIGPRGKNAMLALLAWAQVDPEDVEWIPAGSYNANYTLLREGKGDVCFAFPQAPITFELEAAPHGLSWIEFDAKTNPEAAERFLQYSPDQTFGVMTTGVPSCCGVKGFSSVSGLSRRDDEAELVYHLVKWLAENYDKYKDAHPTCQAMTIDNTLSLAETKYFPLHDGTVRYLEEIGRWTPAHEALNQQNIELLTSWIEAYQNALEAADDKGINVDPENEEWVELWMSYRNQVPMFANFPLGLD